MSNADDTELRLERVHTTALLVPLRDPFVIATGSITHTHAALVEVTLREPSTGRSAVGLGEAAALPGVTSEDRAALEAALGPLSESLAGRVFAHGDSLSWLDALGLGPPARAGFESALLDALTQLAGTSLAQWLAPATVLPHALYTDITLPILGSARMAELAQHWHARGFSCFKVKVGRSLREDLAALEAVVGAVPTARFRIDANGGYSLDDARRLLDAIAARGLRVECFEQPCARDALDAMAALTRESAVPIVADESLRSADDLRALCERRACHGVNLKLAKLGGPVAAYAVGRAARDAGLTLMLGAMVETRLGLAAAAHVGAALGGVEYVDLDTALLLAEDPFTGGYTQLGPAMHVLPGAGVGVRRA